MTDGFFARILKGYSGLLKGMGFVAVLVGASAILGFAAAWPLWFFSTESRTAYTVFCLAAIGGGIIWLIVRAATRRRPARERRGLLVAALSVIAFILVFLAGIYGVVFFLYRGSVLAVFPLAVLLLLGLGWLAYMASARRRSS